MRRELLQLVVGVLLVDAVFVGGYFLFHLERASTTARIGYTAAWTVATLAVVLRGLTRIRALRRPSR